MVEIRKLLDDARKGWESLSWEGTFEQYLNMVIADPDLARYSHTRIYDMVQWAGTAPGPEGVPQYNTFAGEIFGLDRALDRMVRYFHAASQGLEVRKRILLLMGPPASGKSSIVNLLKSGLESYSRAGEGAAYAIVGCPMQEEPLHLIPGERRRELAQDLGLYIEGDLCPRCRYNLRHEYGGDIARVRVRRIVFDQSAGVGMGSFVATSLQSQDISRLVGGVDLSSFSGDRLEDAGKGLRLDGELEAANRGIMEFIEIFKSDERFLTVMLGVTQEQVIKLDSFGFVYADEAIIAHSNEEEYNVFSSNKETAALLDRLILVKIPYNVRLSDEVKIYAKMLPDHRATGHDDPEKRVNIAPLTLHVAAVLSVLSRLEAPGRSSSMPKVSLLDKMRLYDGRILPPYTRSDVELTQEECPREGMFGLSPRYVVNRLADALASERRCLTPSKALKSLADGLAERAGTSKDDNERVFERVKEAVKEYKDLAVREVQRAATEDFQEKAALLFESYIRDVESDTIGNVPVKAASAQQDERLLRRVEGALNLRDGDRPRFRQEVRDAYSHLKQRSEQQGAGPSPHPAHYGIPTLKLALENALFPMRDELKLTIDPGHRDPERQRAREDIFRRLISEYGYCNECAQDLIHFAWRTLQGKEVISVKGGKISWE